MAASQKLDRMLTEATEDLKMAGHGAGKSVRQILEESKAEVSGALLDFAKMVRDKNRAMAEDIRQNGMMVVKKMDDDHRETREAFTEMLGNEVAVSDDHKSGEQG
jgi:phage-related minor tail protein